MVHAQSGAARLRAHTPEPTPPVTDEPGTGTPAPGEPPVPGVPPAPPVPDDPLHQPTPPVHEPEADPRRRLA